MAKKKIKTYEVYIINCGHRHTYLTTTDKREATRKYSTLCGGGALPRISVDGKQLTIEEAYDLYSVQDAARHRVGKYVRKPEIRGCDRRYYDV